MFIALLRHTMRALYPPSEELPGIEDTDLDAFLKRYKEDSPTLMWLGVCAGSAAFVISPVLTVGRPLPSFLLSRELLDKHAHEVTYSQLYLLRQSVFLVKLAAGLCWASHPNVRAKMDMDAYPPDPNEWRTS